MISAKSIKLVARIVVTIFVIIFVIFAFVSAGNSMIVISEAIINYTGLGDSSIGKFFIYGLASFVGFIPVFGQILGAIIAYSVFDWSAWKVMIVFFSFALYIPLLISSILFFLALGSMSKKTNNVELSDNEKKEQGKKTIFGRIGRIGNNILNAVFIIIIVISFYSVVSSSVYLIYPFVGHFADLRSDSFIDKMFAYLVAFIVGITPFFGQVIGAILAYQITDWTIWRTIFSFFYPFLLIFLVTLLVFIVRALKSIFR